MSEVKEVSVNAVKMTVHEEMAECEICDRIFRIVTDHEGFYICPECGVSIDSDAKRKKDAE